MFDADVELHIKGINIDWNKIDSRRQHCPRSDS